MLRAYIASDRITTLALIVVLGAVVIAHAEPPQEKKGRHVASIQYLQAFQMACFPGGADSTNQQVVFRIRSNLPQVRAEGISLSIDRRDGHMLIAIDTDGWFTLPYTREILAENPEIVSNQPKGSLSLECIVFQKSIVLPECRTVAFRKLVEPELLSRAIESLLEGRNACLLPKQLFFRLDRSDIGEVLIQTVGTAEKITVRKGGFFQIALSSKLMAENPMVVFPETTRTVYFVEDCGMPKPELSGRISKF